MTTIVAPPSNASNWQMGFNSVFKGIIVETASFFGVAVNGHITVCAHVVPS